MRWDRDTLLFTVLAFAYSWVMAVPTYLFPSSIPVQLTVSVLFMFGPTLAVLTLKLIGRHLPDLGLRLTPNRWWLVAWLSPPFLVLLTFLVDLLMPGVRFSPDASTLISWLSYQVSPADLTSVEKAVGELKGVVFLSLILYAFIAGATVNALVALGEEVGWRGFLYAKLKGMGFWRMSYTVGVVWGLWHLPLILRGHNYPQHYLLGALMMVLFTSLLSPLMFHIREKGDSVLAPAIFHGTVNAFAGFDLLFLAGGNDLTVGLTGLSGILVLAALNGLLYLVREYA